MQTVVVIAIVTAIVWGFFGPEPALVYAVVNAVAVLIIACPCAVGLATPISMTVAMGQGALNGILFRNAEAMEKLRDVDTLVVDKTGTLTLGRPQLTDVVVTAFFGRTSVLRLIASLERASEHPLAQAIVTGAESRGLALAAVENFDSVTGKGVQGTVAGRRVAVGNRPFMDAFGGVPPALAEKAEALRARGKDRHVRGDRRARRRVIAVADPIKDTTAEAIEDAEARRRAHRDAHGRLAQRTAEAVGAPARHRRGGGRGAARSRRSRT